MSEPTKEQIERLPKWAQDHIQRLTRLKDRAEKALQDATDEQTESPFMVPNWETDTVRFIQSRNRTMIVKHAGVKLEIFLARENDGQRLYGIELRYETHGPSSLAYQSIGIFPRGISTIQLVHKDNMLR